MNPRKLDQTLSGYRMNSVFGIVAIAAIGTRFLMQERYGWMICAYGVTLFMLVLHQGNKIQINQLIAERETVDLTVPSAWTEGDR